MCPTQSWDRQLLSIGRGCSGLATCRLQGRNTAAITEGGLGVSWTREVRLWRGGERHGESSCPSLGPHLSLLVWQPLDVRRAQWMVGDRSEFSGGRRMKCPEREQLASLTLRLKEMTRRSPAERCGTGLLSLTNVQLFLPIPGAMDPPER